MSMTFSKIIGKSPTDFAYKNDILKFRRSTETFWEYSIQEVVSLYIEESITLSLTITTSADWPMAASVRATNVALASSMVAVGEIGRAHV